MRALLRLVKRTAIALGVFVVVAVAAFAVAVAWPEREPDPVRTATPVVIEGVTIIDLRTGVRTPGRTIVIAGGRIVAVGDDGRVDIPASASRIDGRGLFAMPALWDMHTHVYAFAPLLDLPLYIAYGVTNVRDMQGCPSPGDPFIACYEDKQRWSREAEAGARVAPRIVEASSFMANGPGMAERLGGVPEYFDTATPDQARAFVRDFAGHADSIKVYDNIPRDAWLALVDEAQRLGLPVVGHRPRAVSALDVAAHQRSIEHARFLLQESFAGAEALRAAAGTPAWREDRRAMVDQHDPARADAIFAAMIAHDTYYVPTHLTRWSDAYADDPRVRADPALEFLHPLLRMQWEEDLDGLLAKEVGAEARRAYVDFYEKGLELTGRAHRAGVKVMVGTDYIVAGLDVHRELAQLVRAGLTPLEALQAATLVPAAYAGRAAEHDAVAPGRVADLLLLRADPTVDIENSREIETVVFNGNVYGRADLAQLQAHVRDRARSWTVAAEIVWRFIRHPASY